MNNAQRSTLNAQRLIVLLRLLLLLALIFAPVARAEVKLSELPIAGSAATTDRLLVLSDAAGVPVTKTITLGNAVVALPLSSFAATTSAQLAGVISNETGSGTLVFGTSPTLITPALGAATATSINGLTLTSSTGTITITNAKTFGVTNTITLAGTDGTTMTFPPTSSTILGAVAQTFTASQKAQIQTNIGLDPPALNVKSHPYNATGDGTTNDTAAIQAAIDAADYDAVVANRGPGRVYLPPGTYKCNIVLRSGVQLYGAGGSPNGDGAGTPSTILIPASNAAPVITLSSSIGSGIFDLCVRGNGYQTSICGIFWGNGTFTTVRGVDDAAMTATSTTLTSATASFQVGDVGRPIFGLGIPAGTTIAARTNSTTITLSAAATESRTDSTVTLGPTGSSAAGVQTYVGRCLVEGFRHGLWLEGVAEARIHDNSIASCGTGITIRAAANGAPNDTALIENNYYMGILTPGMVGLDIAGCNGWKSVGGDWNHMEHAFRISSGTGFIDGGNFETNQGDWNILSIGANLTVQGMRYGSVGGVPIVRAAGGWVKLGLIFADGMSDIGFGGGRPFLMEATEGTTLISDLPCAAKIFSNATFATLNRIEPYGIGETSKNVIEWSDDFGLEPWQASSAYGRLGWKVIALGGANSGSSRPNHFGARRFYSGNVDGYAGRFQVDVNGAVIPYLSNGAAGAGSWDNWTMTATIYTDTISGCEMRVGLLGGTAADPDDGVYVRYKVGTDTTFKYVTKAGGTATVTDSGVTPASATFYKFTAEAHTNGTVVWTTNGAYVGTTVGNLPGNVPLYPCLSLVNQGSGNNAIIWLSNWRFRMVRLIGY